MLLIEYWERPPRILNSWWFIFYILKVFNGHLVSIRFVTIVLVEDECEFEEMINMSKNSDIKFLARICCKNRLMDVKNSI